MRRLEEVALVLPEVERGDDQRNAALSEDPLAEHPAEQRFQAIGRVLGAKELADRPEVLGPREDGLHLRHIHVYDLVGRQAGPESDLDDAARGCPHHQVEVVEDWSAQSLSRPASRAAVKIPRIPPPSRDRTWNRFLGAIWSVVTVAMREA